MIGGRAGDEAHQDVPGRLGGAYASVPAGMGLSPARANPPEPSTFTSV